MFGGKEGPPALCTDANNKDLAGTDLAQAIICTTICTTQTVGSTLGGCVLMDMDELKVGPRRSCSACTSTPSRPLVSS